MEGGGGVEEKRDLKGQINEWMVEGERLGLDRARFPRNMKEAWLQDEGQSGPQAEKDSAVPQGGSGRNGRALLTRKVTCSFS